MEWMNVIFFLLLPKKQQLTIDSSFLINEMVGPDQPIQNITKTGPVLGGECWILYRHPRKIKRDERYDTSGTVQRSLSLSININNKKQNDRRVEEVKQQ